MYENLLLDLHTCQLFLLSTTSEHSAAHPTLCPSNKLVAKPRQSYAGFIHVCLCMYIANLSHVTLVSDMYTATYL